MLGHSARYHIGKVSEVIPFNIDWVFASAITFAALSVAGGAEHGATVVERFTREPGCGIGHARLASSYRA